MRRNTLTMAAAIAITLVASACSSGTGTGTTGTTGGSGSTSSGPPTTATTSQQGGGTRTPAEAANGFVQGFLSTPAVLPTAEAPGCNFVVPSQRLQCQGAVAAVRLSGTGVSIGHTFTDGNRALVVLLARQLCVSALTQTGKSCHSNSNPNAGLPTSPEGFNAAYAGTLSNTKKGITTIPCIEYSGRWYVNLLAAGSPGSSGPSGSSGGTATSSS